MRLRYASESTRKHVVDALGADLFIVSPDATASPEWKFARAAVWAQDDDLVEWFDAHAPAWRTVIPNPRLGMNALSGLPGQSGIGAGAAQLHDRVVCLDLIVCVVDASAVDASHYEAPSSPHIFMACIVMSYIVMA